MRGSGTRKPSRAKHLGLKPDSYASKNRAQAASFARASKYANKYANNAYFEAQSIYIYNLPLAVWIPRGFPRGSS